MATREQIGEALKAAHAAGDVENARKLAIAYKSLSSAAFFAPTEPDKEYAGFFGSMGEAAATLGAGPEAAAFAANQTPENRKALIADTESKYKSADFGWGAKDDLSGIGRNIEALKETVGGTLGFLAAPAAAATAGLLAGGVGAPIAGYGTAAAQYGIQNIARQAREQQAAIDAGRTPEELSLGKAAVATAGQTALDVVGGRVFGPLLSRFPLLKNLTIGGKSAEESVEVLADAVRKGKLEIPTKGGIARGLGKGVAFEAPQEMAQQALELWQAGVPTDQWKDELIQAGIGGAVLGGPAGAVQARYAAPRQQLQERQKRALGLLTDKYMQKGVHPLMRSGPEMTKEQAAAQAREDIQTGNVDFEPARQLLLGYSPPQISPNGDIRFSQDTLVEGATDTPSKEILDAAANRQKAQNDEYYAYKGRDAGGLERIAEIISTGRGISMDQARVEAANVQKYIDEEEETLLAVKRGEWDDETNERLAEKGMLPFGYDGGVSPEGDDATEEEAPASRYPVPTTPQALKSLITRRVNEGLLDPRQALPVLEAAARGIRAADAGRMLNQIIAENEDRGALPPIGGVPAITRSNIFAVTHLKKQVGQYLSDGLINERQAQQVLSAHKLGVTPNVAGALLNTYVAENNFRKTSPTPLEQFGEAQDARKQSLENQSQATNEMLTRQREEQEQARRRGALVRALESRMENVQRRSMEGGYDPYTDVTSAFSQELSQTGVADTNPTEEEQGYIAGAVRLALSKVPEAERSEVIKEPVVLGERQPGELEQFIPERSEERPEPIQPSLPGMGRSRNMGDKEDTLTGASEETEEPAQDFRLTDDFLTELEISEKDNFTSRVLGKTLRDAVVGLPLSDPGVREALAKYVSNPRVGNAVRGNVEQLLGVKDPNQLELFAPQSERTANIKKEKDVVFAALAEAWRAGSIASLEEAYKSAGTFNRKYPSTPITRGDLVPGMKRYLKNPLVAADVTTIGNKIAAQRFRATEETKTKRVPEDNKKRINLALDELGKLSSTRLEGMSQAQKIQFRNTLRSRLGLALAVVENARRTMRLSFNEKEERSAPARARKINSKTPLTDIQSMLSMAKSATASGDIEEAYNSLSALRAYLAEGSINNPLWETLFDADPSFKSEATNKTATLSEYTEDRVQTLEDVEEEEEAPSVEPDDVVHKNLLQRLEKQRQTEAATKETIVAPVQAVPALGKEFTRSFETKQPWLNKKRALAFIGRAKDKQSITKEQHDFLVNGINAGAKPSLQARAAATYEVLNAARAERVTPKVSTTPSSQQRGYEDLHSKVSEKQWGSILKKLGIDGASLTGAVDKTTYAALAREVNNIVDKAGTTYDRAAIKAAIVEKFGDNDDSWDMVAQLGELLAAQNKRGGALGGMLRGIYTARLMEFLFGDVKPNISRLGRRYDTNGKVRLRRSYERAVGMLANDVMGIVDNLTKDWKSNLNIEVVQSVDELPTNLAVQVTAMGADGVKGLAVRSGNTVFVVANNVNNPADVAATLFHEALGHAGLARAFGAQLDSILRAVYNTNAAYKQRADAWLAANENAYVDENNRELRALEEVLAEESEQGRINPSIFARIVAAVKDFARRLGLDINYTNADVASILAAAHDIVVDGGESRAPTLQETDSKVAFKVTKAAEVQETLSRSRNAEKLAQGAVELTGTFRDFRKLKEFLAGNWNNFDMPATRAGLALMATSDIRGVYGKRLPSIAKLDRIEIEHTLARNTLQTKLDEFIADKWQPFVNANSAAGDVLADLLRASAMVQYDPRKPKAKLSSAEKFVQGLYETLGKTAGGHGLYGTLMDSGKADLYKEVDALFAVVKNEDLPGDIKDPATPKGALYKYIQGLRNKVAKLEVYFPESRFGKYTVAIGSEEAGNLESYTRDTRIERDRLRGALEKELRANKDPRIDSIRLYDTPKEARDNISKASEKELGKIYAALGGKEVGPASVEIIKDAAFQLYMRTLPQTAALKDLEQRRKDITGGSVDVIRGYAAHKYSANNRLARMVYGPQMRNALADIKLEADKVSDPQERLRLNTVAGELNARVNRSLDPRFTDEEFQNGADKLARLGGKAVFYNFLSSPKQFVVQFATIPMIAAPVLAARYGVSLSQMLTHMGRHLRLDRKELSLFNKDYSASRMKDPATRAAFKTVYDELNAGGFFDETRIAEVAAISKKPQIGGTVAARVARKVDSVLRFSFQTAESSVRKVIFATTFEFEYAKAKKETKSPQEALALARTRAVEATYKTAFNYSLWNRPRLFTATPLLRTASQFMIFPMAMSSLLIESFKQFALSPLATVEEKRAALKQFWGIMGMTAVFGGLTGLPLYALITAALDVYAEAMDDDDDEDESNPLYRKNSDLWIREWFIPNFFGSGSGLANAFGLSPEMGALLDRSLKYGPVSALTGLNIASSTSMANLPFMFFIDKDVSNKELETNFYDTMLGPTGALIKNYNNGLKDMAKGDYIRGVEQFLPSVLKAPVTAYRFASEGNVARSGREVRGAEYYTAGRLFLQSLGFADTATFEKENVLYDAAKVGYDIKEEKTALYDALDVAYRRGDNDRVQKIIQEDIFNGFNKRYPSLRISLNDIASSINGRLRERMQSKPSAGLNIGPRGFDRWEREVMGKYADKE